MKVNVYRLEGWTEEGQLEYQFDFEFKNAEYQEVKVRLEWAGYRVQELYAWNGKQK